MATTSMKYQVEFEQEEDGRWIADLPQLPGVMAYGATREEAFHKALSLALHVLADKVAQEKPAGHNEHDASSYELLFA